MTMLTFDNRERIRRARIARIATVSASGRPSVNPLYYTVRHDELWLGTPTWTLAARNCSVNSSVQLLIDSRLHGVTTTLRVVGRARVLTDRQSVRAYNWAAAVKYVVRPRNLANSLVHRHQLSMRRDYHRQSAERGPSAVIAVSVESIEELGASPS